MSQFFKDAVTYILPIILFVLPALLVLLKILYNKLFRKKAQIKGRMQELGSYKCNLIITNVGKAKAYNVDFILEADYEHCIYKEKSPMEYLEPNDYYEERLIVADQTPRKIPITFTWTNKKGKQFRAEQILTY